MINGMSVLYETQPVSFSSLMGLKNSDKQSRYRRVQWTITNSTIWSDQGGPSATLV